MTDILFRLDGSVFSYRVAGVLIRDGMILLHRAVGDPGFSIPGGHVALGETNRETLVREFKEEIGADIEVLRLRWVGEIFFPWGNTPCHQISLFYAIRLLDETQIPLTGVFVGDDALRVQKVALEFHWVPIVELGALEVYPQSMSTLLECGDVAIQHFIERTE